MSIFLDLSLFPSICTKRCSHPCFLFRKSWNDDLGNNNIKPVHGKEQTASGKAAGTDIIKEEQCFGTFPQIYFLTSLSIV